MLSTDVIQSLRQARTEYADLRREAHDHNEFWFYFQCMEVIDLFIARQFAYQEWLVTQNARLLGEIWAINDDLREMIAEIAGL